MYLLNDILSLLWKNEDYVQDFAPSKAGDKNRLVGMDRQNSRVMRRFLFRSLSSIEARSNSIGLRLSLDLMPFYHSKGAQNAEFNFPSLETLSLLEKCKQLKKSVVSMTQPVKAGSCKFIENYPASKNNKTAGNDCI